MLGLVDRYLARNIAVPLTGTLVLAAMLLVLDKMLRLFDFVVTAGGPVSVVWRMLANLLPEYLSLGIPIGLLLGILLAFRKLALSSELDALRGIGIGYNRLLRVPYMYAIALLLVNIAIVGWIDPYARYRYEGLRFDLKSGSLGAAIKVGEFNDFGKRMTLRIDRSEENGTHLVGIFTALDDKSGTRIAATAAEGQFLSTDDPDTIIFRLKRGRLVQEGKDFATPRTLSFQSYDLPINLPSIDPFRGRGNEQKELTLPEIYDRAYGGEAKDLKAELEARANLHFRLVEVVMMLMLPMLAVALAVPPKRSHSSLGIFVGIVMVVTYHKVNQYAEGAGAQGRLIPELALWLPFLGLVALIFWMYHVIAHRPGGQPIGALEAAFAKLAKTLRRLFPQNGLRPGSGTRMINLDFMPSRQLALYAAKLFLTRSLAVLLALVLVLMMLDLLGESSKILKVPGNGEAELWRYVSLRVPLLISRFLPFSVLLGALIAFAGLNQHSEVVSMKAAGLSAHQILAPMIVASLGVAIALFAFNETVVIKSARTVNAWSDADYEPIPPESGIVSNVWIRDGDDLIRARQVLGRGDEARLRGLTIYERESGALVKLSDVERAEQVPGAWKLSNIRSYDARMNVVTRQSEATGLVGVEPEQFTLAKVDPSERDIVSLRQAIDDLEAVGRPSEEARTGWWHKISGPLSTILMPLLAATAAFGLARSGKVLLRATVGMALGFAYFVADNFSLALGNIGAYPPFLAAWAPFFLFLLIGELVLIRQEE